jgi:hypothetical protein
LAKPVRTWTDLVVCTAIAVHWNENAGSIDDPSYPHCVSARVVCWLAQVVKGILDIAGLSFDADGRPL